MSGNITHASALQLTANAKQRDDATLIEALRLQSTVQRAGSGTSEAAPAQDSSECSETDDGALVRVDSVPSIINLPHKTARQSIESDVERPSVPPVGDRAARSTQTKVSCQHPDKGSKKPLFVRSSDGRKQIVRPQKHLTANH